MDLFSSLILICSLVSDTQLVSALATVASERQAYYVRNQGEWKGVRFFSKAQAKVAIGRVANQVYVGPLGVPLSITKERRYSVEQVLDPCRNITVGTEYLKTFLEDCETSTQADPRGCAVKLYAQWIGQPSELFYQQVMKSGSSTKLPLGKVFPDHSSTILVPREPQEEFPKPSTIPQPKPPKPPTPPSIYQSK